MRIATITLLVNLFFLISVNGQILSASHTGLNLSLDVIVNVPENEVTLILTGPETEWFAYGFGGNAMSGTYAIILENDNGTVIT